MIPRWQNSDNDVSEPLLFRVKDGRLKFTQSHSAEGTNYQNGIEQGDGYTEDSKLNSAETATTPVNRGEMSTELPTFITLLERSPLKEKPWVKVLSRWENPFFSLIPIILMMMVVLRVYRRRKLIPGRLQNVVELVVGTFDTFICGVMGKENGRRFMPYIGSLFLFILFNNLLGIIPFMKSPTSSFKTTFALALCTLVYVQYVALKELGFWGYLYHLAGSPRNLIMWMMVPFLFPMHIIGEFAKVASLSLRLFGNVFGEDTLIGVFVFLGIIVIGFMGFQMPMVGFPLQLPFMLLAMLTGFIQALVFTLLAMIYFVLVLPEKET